MIIEQINIVRKNTMFIEKNDENIENPKINENNSSIDATSPRQRNSRVDDIDRINNFIKAQIETNTPSSQVLLHFAITFI